MSNSRDLVAKPAETAAIATLGDQAIAVSDRLDLVGTVSFLRRRLGIILGCAALGLLAGGAFSFFSHKTWRAEATVMVLDTAKQSPGNGPDDTTASVPETQLVDTQTAIIESQDMAARVAQALPVGTMMPSQAVYDILMHRVAAKRNNQTYALTISYDAPSAREAQLVVNEYARQYSQWQVTAEQERNLRLRKQVEGRLEKLRVQAQSDTEALQHYRIAHNLLSTSGASVAEQEISAYNLEVSKARAAAVEDRARLDTAIQQLRQGSSGDDVGEALDSPVISSLRTQEGQLAGQVANLESRYGPNHPALIQSKNQLQEVRSRIQAEIGRVMSNLQAKRNVSQERLSSLDASLEGARAKLADNNAAMVGLSGLERAANASQGIYDTYLSSYKQLLAAEGSERPMARILSLASEPKKPLSPNIPLVIALATVIGLGVGVVGAYITDALFLGVTTAYDVEHNLAENYLASIPLLSSVHAERPPALSAVQDSPRSAFTEAFRVLGTAIDQSTAGRAQVIALTSALPGEGKTMTSCCLAHVLAEGGARTLLIDCDMRRRGISRQFNVGPDHPGLIEILDGTAALEIDHLIQDRMLCVIPLGANSADSERLLTGPLFTQLLEAMRGKFDRIILDLPPILPIAATRTLATRADAVVMVAKWRETSSFAIRTARGRLPKNLVNVVGVALNQVDLTKRAYFTREDPAFYYNKYSEYYT
ncbi:GumC family protein [Novosphingobium rosa]|uniref:GumC family protein n=1 Tax=Novosphingobium rosa TaxID=76978 RepID=UPI0008302D19|nr:Wzz/FepE/Etk N-terminal domain-containing protein [Novosphingobium rosa]